MQRNRIIPIALLFLLMSVGIAARLVQLQGMDWRDHALRASNIHRSIRYTPAPRGQIVDSRGVILARDEPAVRATFLLSELEPVRWVARRLTKILRSNDDTFPWNEDVLWRSIQGAREQIREQFARDIDHQEHPWLTRVDPQCGRAVARAIARRPEDFPGIHAVKAGDSYTISIDPDGLFAGEIGIRKMEKVLALEPGELWSKVELAYDRVQDPDVKLQEREWVFRRQRHPLHEDVPPSLVVAISTEPEKWPGIHLEEVHDRVHPLDPFLGQLLGHTGLPSQAIVDAWESRQEPIIDRLVLRDLRVFEAVRMYSHHSADRVGRSGLESALEESLRGVPGAEVRILDQRRRSVGSALDVANAIKGSDTRLTIDSQLSRFCIDQMQEQGVQTGAVVMLDVRSGAAFCWASLPQQGMEVYRDRDLYRSRSQPRDGWFHDRVSAWPVDPGSTFKTVVGLAALQEGLVTADEKIVCNGVLDPGRPDRSRCSNHPVGITVDLSDALARSCNVYFYKLGQRLGIDKMIATGESLGLWQLSRSGIASEAVGLKPRANPVGTAIGRGFTVTPLQMARVALSIACRGKSPGVKVVTTIDGEAAQPEIELRHFESVIDGMVSAVRDRGGTASRSSYGLSVFDVAVKSGSAQISSDPSYHAWLIGFTPVVEPQFAFAISLQDVPQHGGEACAPLLASILEWLEQHRGMELRR